MKSTSTAVTSKSTTTARTKGLILVAGVAIAGAISCLATLCRVGTVAVLPALAAAILTLIGCLPVFWFSRMVSHGPTRQLLVIAFRLGILFPAFVLLEGWEGDERNCFIVSLLACYFVALPLESWLIIRELRDSSD